MYAVSAFKAGNYPCQPAAAPLFLNSVDLSFLMEIKSDVMKDISSTKMYETFTTVYNIIYKFC